MTTHGPTLEGKLKIWIVEYLSKHCSDHAQILNFYLWHHNNKDDDEYNKDDLPHNTTFNGRQYQNINRAQSL